MMNSIRAFAIALTLLGLSDVAGAGVDHGLPRDNDAEESVARMFEAASHGDQRSLLTAAREVVSSGFGAIEPLYENLADRSATEIIWALKCLKQMGERAGKRALVDLCAHENPRVRQEALISGAILLRAEILPACFKAATDENVRVRRRAIDGLVSLDADHSDCIDVGFAGILERDFWISAQALKLLQAVPMPKKGQNDPVASRTVKLVTRMSDQTAERLFGLVAQRRSKNAARLVKVALDDGNDASKVGALAMATRMRKIDVNARARELLRLSATSVRRAAISYLAARKDQEAVDGLIDVLDEPRIDGKLRDDTAVALRRITGKLFGFDVSAWREYALGESQ